MDTVSILLCELEREELQSDEAGLRPPPDLVLCDGGTVLLLRPVLAVNVSVLCRRDLSGPDHMDAAHAAHLKQGVSRDRG